jgi:DHA1 family inner membrane transport protein
VGNLLGGFMADKLGWFITLKALCVAQMIVMPFYSFLPISLPAFFTLTVVWAIIGWSFMAGQQMRLIGLAGPKAPVVLALTAASIYIGAAIGSAVGSIIITYYGFSGLGIAAAGCASLALANIILSHRYPPAAHTG